MPKADMRLRLARLHLDSRKLIELGRRRRLPIRDVDTGYLVHCMMGELFGDAAPKPFSVGRQIRRSIEILAYTGRSEEELRRHADAFADPWVHGASDWDEFAVKPMPEAWPPGTRVAFSARVCPVVRVARGSTTHRPGAELDAFLARCAAEGSNTPVSRQDVYREWFMARIPPAAARPRGLRLEGFKLERLVRRNQAEDRTSSVKARPDVHVAGELQIVNGDAFTVLLGRGIGRHRAFGFGMLLLRPPAP